MIKSATFELYALTPIITGGRDGKTDRLHETGLIGSMRWWFEIIAREFGISPCNINDDNRCIMKTIAEQNSLCPVCQIFGCTGYKRRFSLRIAQDIDNELKLPQLFSNTFNKSWMNIVFEKSFAYNAGTQFQVIVLAKDPQILRLIQGLLVIMSEIGGIGSKTQYGFGQFRLNQGMTLSQAFEIVNDNLSPFVPSKANTSDIENKLWWYLIDIDSKNKTISYLYNKHKEQNKNTDLYLPVAFDLKYKFRKQHDFSGLRFEYVKTFGKREAKEVFGFSTKERKQKSRVFVSHLIRNKDDYRLKVWGITNMNVGIRIGRQLSKIFDLKNPEINYLNLLNEDGVRLDLNRKNVIDND